MKLAELDFAVLFHYGRSDLSVAYNGAKVGPEEIKQIINANKQFGFVKNFRLVSYEGKQSHKHLLFAVEMKEGNNAGKHEQQELFTTIIDQLQVMNLDFKSALRTSPLKPEIRFFEADEGIFDPTHQKLKNDYVWNIDYERAKKERLAD